MPWTKHEVSWSIEATPVRIGDAIRKMKLGEIFIQLGMLTPEQVQAVLGDRSLVGGRLGTQLVERGLLATDQVSEALGRQQGVPAAQQRHFDRADPAVVAMLKPNLAVRYMAIPLVAARGGAKRIVVAMASPQDMLLVDDISFALGARVEPMIASELAIARNLKRFYNIEIKLDRPARFEGPHRSPGTPLSGEIPSLAGMAPLASPEAPQPWTVDLEDVLHRMSVAEHREQIADILIDFMLPRFGCGLILLLRGGSAHVWRGFAPGVDALAIETIAFPMSIPSMFRTAKERVVPYRGAPPFDGIHVHGQIWKYLRCEVPSDVLVIPIPIGQRIISLVYAHAIGMGSMPDTSVRELQALCSAMSSAFVRLIQRAKEGHRPTPLLPH